MKLTFSRRRLEEEPSCFVVFSMLIPPGRSTLQRMESLAPGILATDRMVELQSEVA